ncbi:purple acid phosphatase family protein [Parapedobacter indicus]|uniref:Purple acid Phosphatase, N-terminal domain n=1 Tax=Parapedobacter indicus TaxID=1477437 RepID=A0A1I3RR51_9SPHI|nr:metallophosphoesterase family protein [Parapedobacter indicus]PPL00029.1 purple acid phosphatase-like protein [Parapedobacter indicus]SFJ48530.1 Purple acid Phosphatase, N-terminal domain [Parapedobacter indicus]
MDRQLMNGMMSLDNIARKVRQIARCLSWSVILMTGCTREHRQQDVTVQRVMDSLVTRIYAQWDARLINVLDENLVLKFVDPEERTALAENYWRFRVDVPVVVSLMRDSAQASVPFWLVERGFEKTGYTVRNELYTYEVWQKSFPAGEIGLGINGFDKHRPVYFVGVAPQHSGKKVNITPIIPQKQAITVLDTGAFTYHDWDELVLTEVPQTLSGQLLLPTIRGRAREAHLIGAFRRTEFPSTAIPDQVILTLPDDAKHGMTVQWRCTPDVQHGWIKYWQPGAEDTVRVDVDGTLLEDRMLRNDRYVSRFRVQLDSLQPGTVYQYRVGHGAVTGETATFTTPDAVDTFAFTWFGDIHNDPMWGKLAQDADVAHPQTDFYLSVGDLVNTGLHRDDWDALFAYSGGIFREKPLMAVPGNHDSQDGLGAGMFRELLSYPENGPDGLPTGFTYAFRYKHALFLMIDVVSFSVSQQAAWIESQLSKTDATWKFVVFHFPPYTLEEPYPDIVKSWVPLFDKYGVDMVMNGHFHYYLRTRPMKGSQPVEPEGNGTKYVMSVSTRGKNDDSPAEPYGEKVFKKGYLYQHVQLDGRRLSFICKDAEGTVLDRFELTK